MGFTDGYKTYDTSNGYGDSRQWRKEFHTRMTGEQADEILNSQEQTPWEILGILKGASMAEIKKAYRQMMIKWHPDKNPDNQEQATEMSKIINAAYCKLS